MAFNPNQPEISKLLTLSTKEGLVAKKFEDKFALGGISIESLTTDEAIIEELKKNRLLIGPGATADLAEVVKIVKERIVTPYQEKIKAEAKLNKKAEPIPEPEFIPTVAPKIGGDFRVVHNEQLDETSATNIKKQEEENEMKESKKNIGADQEALNEISEKANREVLMADFHPEEYIAAGIYTKEEVDRHNEEVKNLEVIYEEKNTPEKKEIKKKASIFEAVVVKSINLSKCLGEDVIARPGYPIDDLTAPKVDAYVILKDVPLGLDVKMGNLDGVGFIEKIEKILRVIKKGNPDGIKYFKDKNGELKKGVRVPKVVISCEDSMINDLMYYFKNLPDDKFSEKLQSHRMSIEVVSQIMGGCLALGNYAREIGQTEVADSYGRVRETIYKISEESPILKRLLNGAGHDSLSKKIQEIIVNFKKKEAAAQADLEEFRKLKKAA